MYGDLGGGAALIIMLRLARACSEVIATYGGDSAAFRR